MSRAIGRMAGKVMSIVVCLPSIYRLLWMAPCGFIIFCTCARSCLQVLSRHSGTSVDAGPDIRSSHHSAWRLKATVRRPYILLARSDQRSEHRWPGSQFQAVVLLICLFIACRAARRSTRLRTLQRRVSYWLTLKFTFWDRIRAFVWRETLYVH
jgi:hypothetical protein